MATEGSTSNLSKSLLHICNRYNVIGNICEHDFRSIKQDIRSRETVALMQKAGLVRDLLEIKQTTNDRDVTFLIDELCVE